MEDFQLETVITLLTPYAAYIPAEHLGVSGVLATVAAGGYLGWRNPELLSALTRFRGRGVWSVLLLLFNGLVFILIGLQLASIRALITGIPWRDLIGYSAAVSGVAIVARLVYVPIGTYLPRLLSPQAARPRSQPALAGRRAHRLDGDARHRLAGAGAGAAADAAERRAVPAARHRRDRVVRGHPGDAAAAGADAAGADPRARPEGRRRRPARGARTRCCTPARRRSNASPRSIRRRSSTRSCSSASASPTSSGWSG